MGAFEGRKLIAVGGSSGMGRQTAEDVVAAGGSAVIVGRTRPGSRTRSATCQEREGLGHHRRPGRP